MAHIVAIDGLEQNHSKPYAVRVWLPTDTQKSPNLGQIDVPITFGGIVFEPGRYLVADEDGVVIHPAGLMESDIDTEGAIAATTDYVTNKQN